MLTNRIEQNNQKQNPVHAEQAGEDLRIEYDTHLSIIKTVRQIEQRSDGEENDQRKMISNFSISSRDFFIGSLSHSLRNNRRLFSAVSCRFREHIDILHFDLQVENILIKTARASFSYRDKLSELFACFRQCLLLDIGQHCVVLQLQILIQVAVDKFFWALSAALKRRVPVRMILQIGFQYSPGPQIRRIFVPDALVPEAGKSLPPQSSSGTATAKRNRPSAPSPCPCGYSRPKGLRDAARHAEIPGISEPAPYTSAASPLKPAASTRIRYRSLGQHLFVRAAVSVPFVYRGCEPVGRPDRRAPSFRIT